MRREVDDARRFGLDVARASEVMRDLLPLARDEVSFPDDFLAWDNELHERGNDLSAARDVVRGMAAIIAAQEDGSGAAIDALVAALEGVRGDELHDERSDGEAVAEALTLLLCRLDPAAPATADIVASRDAEVRRSVAKALDLRAAAGKRHLMTLAADRDVHVRKEAARRLRGVELPWWLGMFDDDPLARLGPDDLATVVPSLIALAAEVKRIAPMHPYDDALDLPLLWRLVKAVPGSIAAEVVPRLLDRELHGYTTLPLLAALLSHPEGASVFVRVVETADAHVSTFDHVSDKLTARWPALAGGLSGLLDDDARLRACLAGIDAIARDRGGSSTRWPRIIAALWPAGADPNVVLDAMLASDDMLAAHLLSEVVCAHARPDHAATRRVVEAHLAGYPGWPPSRRMYVMDVVERLEPAVLEQHLALGLWTERGPSFVWPLMRGLARQAPERVADWVERLEAAPEVWARVIDDEVIGPLLVARLRLRVEAGVASEREVVRLAKLEAAAKATGAGGSDRA